jgi:hypothetical protein
MNKIITIPFILFSAISIVVSTPRPRTVKKMTFSRLQQQLNAGKCFRIESIPYRRRRQAPASWTAARQMPLPLHRFQKELLAFSVIDHVVLNVFVISSFSSLPCVMYLLKVE